MRLADLFKTIWPVITSYLVKAGGIKGWVLKKVMEYGGQYLYDLIFKAERKKEQDKAQEKLEEKLEDPKSTPEETGKAYENFLNSGKR